MKIHFLFVYISCFVDLEIYGRIIYCKTKNYVINYNITYNLLGKSLKKLFLNSKAKVP